MQSVGKRRVWRDGPVRVCNTGLVEPSSLLLMAEQNVRVIIPRGKGGEQNNLGFPEPGHMKVR